MGALNFSQVEAIIIEGVNPEIQKQFEESKQLYNRFLRGKAKKINNRGYRIANFARPSGSDGYFGEAGAMPATDNPQFYEMRVYPTRYATGFDFSGDVIDNLTEGDPDALIDAVTDIIELSADTAKKTLDYQVAGKSTGEIAVVLTRDSGTQATMASTYAAGSLWGAIKIKEGARLQFIDPATGTVRNGATAVVQEGGVNRSTQAVTFDAVGAAVAAGDLVVFENSYNRAPHGLYDLINNDTGLMQGQSRASRPDLRSVVVDNGGALINVAVLVQLMLSLRFRTEEQGGFTLFSGPTQKAGFMSNAYNLERFQGGGGTLRMDFDDVQFGKGGSWEAFVGIDPDRVYGILEAKVQKFELMKFGAYAKDGLTMRQYTSGGTFYDRWLGWLGTKYDLGALKFGCHFLLKNNSVANLPTPASAWA